MSLKKLQLKKLFEFRWAKSSVTGNSAHCEGVNGIMPGNSQSCYAIGHDNVFALTNDPKAGLFQGPNCLFGADARDLRHIRPSLHPR